MVVAVGVVVKRRCCCRDCGGDVDYGEEDYEGDEEGGNAIRRLRKVIRRRGGFEDWAAKACRETPVAEKTPPTPKSERARRRDRGRRAPLRQGGGHLSVGKG